MTTQPVVALASTLAQVNTREVSTTDVIVMIGIVVVTFVITRLIRPLARRVLTTLARRSLTGVGRRWRVRTPRLFGETDEQAELRRRQRIAAAAAALSRALSIVLWALALVAVLQRAEIDPAFAISSVGFLGVAIAIGGQHSVNDFLTGMHILFEDRFGVGDRLRLLVADELKLLTVVEMGPFATTLEGEDATYHIPNRELTTVANLSQQGSTAELDFAPADLAAVTPSAIEEAVRSRYMHTVGFDGSRDGIVVDAIEPHDGGYTVRVRTARPMSPAQLAALSRSAD